MKKRIISMLLAVCMVVACTLAITPAVSAVEKTTITATSVTGDIGDVVAVPLVVETPDGSNIEWNGLQIYFYPSGSAELLKVVDSEGNESSVGEGGLSALKQHQGNEVDDEKYKSLDYYVFTASNGVDGNASVSNGGAVVTAYYEITGFQATELLIDVARISYIDDTKPTNLDFDYVPGTFSVDGSIESLPEFTASNVKVTSADDDARAADQDEADAYNDGAYNSKNTKIVDRTITLTNNFEGDVAYISAESWESIESSINSKYGKHSTRAGKCTVVDSTAAIGTAKNTITIISAKKDKFTVPATIYIDANVDLSLSNVGQQFLKKAENVYFVGDFNAASLEAITSAAADDEDCCALDYLCDSDATVYAWNGSKVFNFFSGTVAATYCTDIYEDDPVEVKAIDSFVPVGYQGPAEITGKKFRVDSAIKYADTQFVVDEQPKNIYDTASCNITVKGKAGGVDVDKKLTKEIGTVYKSLSGVNGVAVPACGAYYFSALAISDLPELQEGEELVFTFTNTVTNIFGGETTSEPVSLTYHADGSITQE